LFEIFRKTLNFGTACSKRNSREVYDSDLLTINFAQPNVKSVVALKCLTAEIWDL